MKEIWLHLNGKDYSCDEMTSDTPGQRSEFETATLSFCRDWLQGRDHFTLTTSGSTGAPKSITLRREQMEASARMTASALALRAGYTSLIALDTRYIAGQMMLVRSFVTGMNMVAVEPSANPFQVISPAIQIDFAAIVPYQLQSILGDPDSINRLNHLKAGLVGGAALSAEVKRLLLDMKAPLYLTYGMTETISHIALQRLTGPGKQDYFQVLPGISISTDERGCLIISAGYLGTDKIVTNDTVELIGPQAFLWLGRWDRVINSGGIKISPEKIETEFEKILDILRIKRRCFATGVPDERLGSRAILVMEGEILSEPDRQRLLVQLTTALGPYQAPKEIRFVPQFAVTASQKVDQQATIRGM